ncbi:LOW QUALITY PROTEIN: uncharacterized protein LOC106645966 [Copidosoma floridanum]|uniref:LOW QUALITY PROTEIN: uncharacterized protein LOC106645966 n=1 Tax=Copidosoma floridanum TaxID=29053 RepID=UPI000C6FAADE|nr:LOW QUALITY PROTEIN: uncharacterized protein LOC106645966 [Copidosoma floridanum]
MQELEDEPKDVQNARPVEEEVKKAETSECLNDATPAPKPKKPNGPPPHRCQKAVNRYFHPREPSKCPMLDYSPKRGRRNRYRQRSTAARKRSKRPPDTTTVYIHGPECKPHKMDRTPRHCMNKKEYLDFLATPSKKCEPTCEKLPVVRKVRPIPARIEELARPTKRRLILTLEERAELMPARMLDHLIELVEAETALTPEQAEDYVRDRKLQAKPGKKPKKKRKKGEGCSGESVLVRQGSGDEPCLDAESAKCQYAMAVRFVRSILVWRCCRPASEYRDIAEVVLRRLSQLLEYEPRGVEDRKSRQMRLLADLFACWIAGLLIELAEMRKGELEAECLRRKLEAEERAALLEQEAALTDGSSSLDDYDDDDDYDANADEEDLDDEGTELGDTGGADGHLLSGLASDADIKGDGKEEEEEDSSAKVDAASQYIPGELDLDGEDEEEEETGDEDGSPVCCCADASLQTDTASRANACTAAESVELNELEKMASRVGASLHTNLPFLTFARILDTLYSMIECESENRLCDPMINRLHRAIYEKCEPVLRMDGEEHLGERIKDVLDVVAGKIARWLHHALDEKQIRLLDEATDKVESREVREWSRWMVGVADMAEKWTGWIDEVAGEAKNMGREPQTVTRQAWQDWTARVEGDAKLWRRAYMEAQHHQHHNTMMICDRKVVKRKPPELTSEMAIKNTNLDTASKIC